MQNPEELRRQIGENLAHFREEAGLTQTELGALIGHEKNWIYRREAGQVSIDLEDLPGLMDALNIADPREFWNNRGSGRIDLDGY